jgi:hypothetical protein
MKASLRRALCRLTCAALLALTALAVLGRLVLTPAVRAEPGRTHEERRAPATTQVTHTVYLPLVLNNAVPDSIPGPPLGIQFYSNQAPLDSRLDYAVAAGAGWIRWPVPWSEVEPVNTTPENYDWSVVDAAVTNVTQNGARLILTLADQPSWSAVYAMGPVTDTADLLEFVGALVERYDGDGLDDAPGSPEVRLFEAYNEPDNVCLHYALHGGWSYYGHDGAGYAALLQELYPAVKAASPRARLLFGGLALDWFEDRGGCFDRGFLDDVLEACQGQDCFDVMNLHYFPAFRAEWEAYGADIIGKVNYVRQRMAAYGFEETPVICTETYWASSGWGNDELQSRYVVKGYARGLAAGLEMIVWYFIQDGDNPNTPGLLRNDLSPKPSYWAYQTMSTMLGEARYERTMAASETGSEQLVGYTFTRAGRRLDIVWTEDGTDRDPSDDPLLPLTVEAEVLRVVGRFGNETWLRDENDGLDDGRITVIVGGSPLFLEHYP